MGSWNPTNMIFLTWVGATIRLALFYLAACGFAVLGLAPVFGRPTAASQPSPGESAEDIEGYFVLPVFVMGAAPSLVAYLVVSYIIFGFLVGGNFEGALDEAAFADTANNLAWLAQVVVTLAKGLWLPLGLIGVRVGFLACRDIQVLSTFFHGDTQVRAGAHGSTQPFALSCFTVIFLLSATGIAVVVHALFRNLFATALSVALTLAVFDIAIVAARVYEARRST